MKILLLFIIIFASSANASQFSVLKPAKISKDRGIHVASVDAADIALSAWNLCVNNPHHSSRSVNVYIRTDNHKFFTEENIFNALAAFRAALMAECPQDNVTEIYVEGIIEEEVLYIGRAMERDGSWNLIDIDSSIIKAGKISKEYSNKLQSIARTEKVKSQLLGVFAKLCQDQLATVLSCSLLGKAISS